MRCARLFAENFGLQALCVYRFGRWLRGIRDRPLGLAANGILYPAYWLMAAYVRLAYGIQLEQSADIGPGLYIGHFGGIRVVHCRIGPHCSLQQQVKLGTNDISAPGPTIGTRVWIGGHAQITGDIQIGDSVTISAGARVTQDIPAGCLVMGNPGRVTQRNYDNSSFL